MNLPSEDKPQVTHTAKEWHTIFKLDVGISASCFMNLDISGLHT